MAKRKSAASTKSKGLGDTVEKITKKTGIKKVVEALTPEGKDCGCDARKELLNRLFPYNKPECLTDEEAEFIGSIIKLDRIDSLTQTKLNAVYNRVFHDKQKSTSCAPCLKDRIQKLKTVYDTHYADN